LPAEAEAGSPLETPGADPEEPPEVVAVTRPTELVWTDGPPDPAPVAGTDLSYVRNTHSDLFLEHRSQSSFLLLSGRWYRSKAGETSWTYVPSDQLPSDFGRIPPGSPKEHVLVSVAGTRQAEDALRDAQIPQTAALRRNVAPDFVVPYDGPPRFVKIKGSPVQYAENTPSSVFLVGARYYCCHLAVWYESQGPKGPWEICAAVPSEIYLIPPSCPEYHCTCCYVYGATPEVVYVGYTPGYLGCYGWGSTVVFGTGWPYRGWKGTAWYPRPLTFGLSISYDFGTGCWEFEFGLWGPCAWAGLGYNPGHRGHAGVGGWTGGVSRYRGTGVAYSPGLHQYRNEVVVHNLFASQPRLQAPGPARPSAPAPASGTAVRTSNNVFTDKEGSAYRKHPQGGWEKHTAAGWAKMAPSKPSGASGFGPLEHRLEQRDLARSLGQGGVRELPMHSASAHAPSSRPSYSPGPPSPSPSSGSRPGSPPPPKK